MNYRYLFFILLFNSLMSGCTPLTVVTTGAQAIYDHHSINKKFNDNYVTIRAYQKIYNDTDKFQDTNVSVATFNNEILLTGEIPDAKQRDEIEQLIRSLDVKKVYNFTSIATPSSALTRVSDTWITTKIKTKLIAMQDIDPSQIKVVTENGTVYLMGIVLHEQADCAVELAQTTEGVQNVVKIFSYLTISKA